jgi:hypothetical protein
LKKFRPAQGFGEKVDVKNQFQQNSKGCENY